MLFAKHSFILPLQICLFILSLILSLSLPLCQPSEPFVTRNFFATTTSFPSQLNGLHPAPLHRPLNYMPTRMSPQTDRQTISQQTNRFGALDFKTDEEQEKLLANINNNLVTKQRYAWRHYVEFCCSPPPQNSSSSICMCLS